MTNPDFRPPFSWSERDTETLTRYDGAQEFDVIRDALGFPLILVQQTDTATQAVVKHLNQSITQDVVPLDKELEKVKSQLHTVKLLLAAALSENRRLSRAWEAKHVSECKANQEARRLFEQLQAINGSDTNDLRT